MTGSDNGRLVLDSFAIFAIAQDEPAAGVVRELLERARRGEALVWMSVINLGEVFYVAARRFGEQRAGEVLRDTSEAPIEFVDADRELTLAAAELKSVYRMSYADCFAAALAQRLDASVVTGDPEFREVEHLVDVMWLAR